MKSFVFPLLVFPPRLLWCLFSWSLLFLWCCWCFLFLFFLLLSWLWNFLQSQLCYISSLLSSFFSFCLKNLSVLLSFFELLLLESNSCLCSSCLSSLMISFTFFYGSCFEEFIRLFLPFINNFLILGVFTQFKTIDRWFNVSFLNSCLVE